MGAPAVVKAIAESVRDAGRRMGARHESGLGKYALGHMSDRLAAIRLRAHLFRPGAAKEKAKR